MVKTGLFGDVYDFGIDDQPITTNNLMKMKKII